MWKELMLSEKSQENDVLECKRREGVLSVVEGDGSGGQACWRDRRVKG
jgi:hypothetical protein